MADVQAAADAVELPTGDVVQGFEIAADIIEVPVPVAEDAFIRSGSDGFSEEKVVVFLVMRFGDEAADEIGGATFNERGAMPFRTEGFGAAIRQFVRVVAATRAAEGNDLCGLPRKRHLYAEVAAFFDEAAGVGSAVNDGGDFGWIEVEETNPGRALAILAATVGSGKDDRRTVIEEAVGLRAGDSWAFLQALADVCGGIGFRAVLWVESGDGQDAGADFFAGAVAVRADKQRRTEDTQVRVTERGDRLFQRAFHARIKEGRAGIGTGGRNQYQCARAVLPRGTGKIGRSLVVNLPLRGFAARRFQDRAEADEGGITAHFAHPLLRLMEVDDVIVQLGVDHIRSTATIAVDTFYRRGSGGIFNWQG